MDIMINFAFSSIILLERYMWLGFLQLAYWAVPCSLLGIAVYYAVKFKRYYLIISGYLCALFIIYLYAAVIQESFDALRYTSVKEYLIVNGVELRSVSDSSSQGLTYTLFQLMFGFHMPILLPFGMIFPFIALGYIFYPERLKPLLLDIYYPGKIKEGVRI